MKILVTGASGFIGRYVVNEALGRGHEVVAMARARQSGDTAAVPSLQWLCHDLGGADAPPLQGRSIDAVVHLAASLAGQAEQQMRDTVFATRQLLAAMRQAGVRRLVGISSIAVLDYPHLPAFSMIDETASCTTDDNSGIYARMKLAQEKLFTEFLASPQSEGVILRPGLVYDEQTLFAAHAGIFKGPLRLVVAHSGEVPVVAAKSLAVAIVNAAELELRGAEIAHLLDDRLPGIDEYVRALRRRKALPAGCVHLHWRVLAAAAMAIRGLLGLAGMRRSVPEALMPHGFAARLTPYRFSNDKAKRLLSWTPGGNLA